MNQETLSAPAFGDAAMRNEAASTGSGAYPDPFPPIESVPLSVQGQPGQEIRAANKSAYEFIDAAGTAEGACL